MKDMTMTKKSPLAQKYVDAMDYEYADMINVLNYLCREAEAAKLDLVSLHLNIAIAELKEYHLPTTKVG